MNKRKAVLGITIFILILTICLMFLLMHTRASNAEAFDRRLNNPEKLFHGTFNTTSDWSEESLLKADEICISFSNENLNYDEKNLTFADYEKGIADGFNSYFIRHPGDTLLDEETGEHETTWYLCKYDDVNSVLLLDENNAEIGRISFTVGKADWLGKRRPNYYWRTEGKTIPIYKRIRVPYSAGTSYLKSKYYSGVFLGG